MERTHRSTLTDCACDLWTVVASPFCNRFLPVSKHFLFGHLVVAPHTLDLLCEDKVSILQHTEGGDDPAKYEVCSFRIREGKHGSQGCFTRLTCEASGSLWGTGYSKKTDPRG